MKVAIAAKNDVVADPGECEEIHFYDLKDGTPILLKKIENPGKNARAAKGVVMLRSALENGADAIIVNEIGRPGVNYLKGKAKIFLADGMNIEDAIHALSSGRLKETVEPTHEGGHREHHL